MLLKMNQVFSQVPKRSSTWSKLFSVILVVLATVLSIWSVLGQPFLFHHIACGSVIALTLCYRVEASSFLRKCTHVSISLKGSKIFDLREDAFSRSFFNRNIERAFSEVEITPASKSSAVKNSYEEVHLSLGCKNQDKKQGLWCENGSLVEPSVKSSHARDLVHSISLEHSAIQRLVPFPTDHEYSLNFKFSNSATAQQAFQIVERRDKLLRCCDRNIHNVDTQCPTHQFPCLMEFWRRKEQAILSTRSNSLPSRNYHKQRGFMANMN
ncbi:hypothetical protein O6H91_13G003200 [Diphasiastrum complanatum]|uniref:Uncharacterized protein n=1 Tax=Diphasiastrum complanatum TaxID=34168 RepID=A0ACC2BRQ3_DIPCM|nr:hypothetical protein O6H91_13G003200 [Diphasiastrum complanatum]